MHRRLPKTLVVVASTPSQIAIYLGIYASVVATLTGLWTLFSGIFLDRARIKVAAVEGFLVKTVSGTTKGTVVVKSEEILQTMGVPEQSRTPILEVGVRNKVVG